MVDTRTDYPPDEVAAARAVMLELVRLLGEYRDDMVIVGGVNQKQSDTPRPVALPQRPILAATKTLT